MSRRGICHIWLRGRHISPAMPYREARSVEESSEGPTASKSDRTGRNPGMTRLVRRSSATAGGTAFFSLVETFRQRIRKCSSSPMRSLPKKIRLIAGFLHGIDLAGDSTCINVTEEPCVSVLLETEVRDGFMRIRTPKRLCYKHGGSRVKLSLWPFCGRIPGPTDTIWQSFES